MWTWSFIVYAVAPRGREMKIPPIVVPWNKVESSCFLITVQGWNADAFSWLQVAELLPALSAQVAIAPASKQRSDYGSGAEPAREPRAARRFSGASTSVWRDFTWCDIYVLIVSFKNQNRSLSLTVLAAAGSLVWMFLQFQTDFFFFLILTESLFFPFSLTTWIFVLVVQSYDDILLIRCVDGIWRTQNSC